MSADNAQASTPWPTMATCPAVCVVVGFFKNLSLTQGIDGRATIQQFFEGTQTVFGMAPVCRLPRRWIKLAYTLQDLAGFLAVYGAVVDGNGLGWTIEGGPHVGIGGSHGNYETDSSPLMGDLNQYGDLSKLIMSQFYDVSFLCWDP